MMKKITTPTGVFGPYQTVEVMADRYRCDGADMPFTVIGEGSVEDASPEDFPPPPPAPAPVPQSVTMRQARLALLGAGLLDNIDAAIASIPDEVQRRAATIEWEYANTVERNSAFVQQMAAGLAMSAEQMDQLFITAATL
jgi:hypothetical protein